MVNGRRATVVFRPADSGRFRSPLEAPPEPGQTQEKTVCRPDTFAGGQVFTGPYAVEITLSNPYTFRATAMANVTGLLAAIALFALGLSVLVVGRDGPPVHDPAAPPDRGVARPGRGRPHPARPAASEVRAGSSELAELAVQFNAMADRLEESVEIIRRDRDRSRDFLADVSHELRTPLAALRTFNELLTEGAADDPDARAEFLESSGQQIERLDWLAQNLLELSKLDSGLVLLDLRPDDLRAAVESAVEQTATAAAAARRRRSTLHLPVAPDPDPPRPAADRPGRHQPRRQRDQVHAARRVASRSTWWRTPDGGAGSRSPTPASASTRPSCPTSSSASTAARGPTRRAAAGAAWGSRSSARSWTCTAARSRSRAGRGRVAGSRCTLPTDPRLVAGTPAAERAAVASAADGPRASVPDGVCGADRERAGNFTVRAPSGEPGTRTLEPPDITRGRSPASRLARHLRHDG